MKKHLLFIVLSSFFLFACSSNEKQTYEKDENDNTNSYEKATNKKISIKKWKEEQDLWVKIQRNLNWNVPLNNRVIKQLNWFANNPSYMKRVSQRAAPYLFHIVTELEKNNVPLEIALLPIVESAYRPHAYSHASASGLWQFIPSTGKIYNLEQNWWYDGRRDILNSTGAAISYLTFLADKFDGDWLKALASYNAGSGRVNSAIRKNEKKGLPTDYWNLDLPKETEAYVPKLLALSHLVKNASDYGIEFVNTPNKKHMTFVDVSSQIDLYLAAKLADIAPSEIYKYNPGYNRWATPPMGPHRIVLPISKEETFKKNLAKTQKNKRVSWLKHKVKKGETLSAISERHKTDRDQIRKINKLRSDKIKRNKILLIPHPAKHTIAANYIAKKKFLPPLYNSRSFGKRQTYRVRSGDSLWKIAKKYKVSINRLASWNKISKKRKLQIGQRLKIYSSYKPRFAKAKVKKHKNKNIKISKLKKHKTKKLRYSVKKGDSLYGIASKFKVSVSELKKWNKARLSSKYLQLGTRLLLYVAKR
jgi:membrane-bound lytic murein transglycosylase D